MGIGLLASGACAEGPRINILNDSGFDEDFVYSGCPNEELPLPWGITEEGISYYLSSIAYPEMEIHDHIAAEQVPALLRDLKRVLNLTTTDLAAVCDVTRPTIYSWRKGGSIAPENLKRLEALSKLLTSWSMRLNQNLFSVPSVPGSPELKEMLFAETLDEQTIEKLLASLAETARDLETKRPKTGRELAEAHGMEPLSEDAQERNMMMVRLSAGSGR